MSQVRSLPGSPKISKAYASFSIAPLTSVPQIATLLQHRAQGRPRFARGGRLPQADGETQLLGPCQKVGERRIGFALFPFAELVSVDPNSGREIFLPQVEVLASPAKLYDQGSWQGHGGNHGYFNGVSCDSTTKHRPARHHGRYPLKGSRGGFRGRLGGACLYTDRCR